jgi:predicted nucleotide-binding protein
MVEGIERLKKRLAELQAFDVAAMREKHPPELTALEKSIERSIEKTFGASTTDAVRFSGAASLTYSPSFFVLGDSEPTPLSEYVSATRENIREAEALLQQAIQGLEEDYAEAAARGKVVTPKVPAARAPSRKVFVVHGHDEGARESVARFLEKLGFTAIVLHEQANKGRTIIEKIEANSDVSFAVVLLTGDDEGRKKGDSEMRSRARQNVILELGYFVGILGREHVCALKRGDVEIPSDFGGVVYEQFDENGGWKAALGKELEAAGHSIDWKTLATA